MLGCRWETINPRTKRRNQDGKKGERRNIKESRVVAFRQ